MFMMQLDATVVNVALPKIGLAFHAPLGQLQWVIDGYILPLASLLLIGGRLGDRYGHKRVFIFGLALFALGSGLCAAASSPAMLIAFRALQGIGAAFELPATLAILSHAFPEPRERARAIGLWAGIAGLSLAFGPIVGGTMVDAFGWPSVFLINLPIAAIAIVIAARAVEDSRREDVIGLDVVGQLFGMATLGLAAYGAIEGRYAGWGSTEIVTIFSIAAVCLVVFLWVERRGRAPVLPLGLLRGRTFAAANAGGLVMGFALFGLLFLFSLFFQLVQEVSPTQAGVRFVPLSIAFVVSGALAGRVVARAGYRAPLAAGLALVGSATLLLLKVQAQTSYGSLVWIFVLIGIGYGFASAPMAAVVMGSVSSDRLGVASAVNNTARQVGGVFGVAVVGALLGNPPYEAPLLVQLQYAHNFIHATHIALLTCGIAALVGATLAGLFVRSSDIVTNAFRPASIAPGDSADALVPEVTRLAETRTVTS
jgi:DHA2 family methylenomycin A resistance protein-like MFS transporter